MKLGKISTFIIAGAFAVSSQAQDIHFSQYYASPLNMNPATVGVMPCKMRISGIYRNQWASVMGGKAYNTFSAAVDAKMPVGNNDYVGMGLNIWADKAGASKFSNIQITVAGSFLKKIGGRRSNEHFLVAGAQIGVSQRSLKTDDLTWGTQWDGDQYNGNLPTLENIGNLRRTFADINAGILWFSALDKKANSNIYGGIAFSHLTRANISHVNQGQHFLYSKFTVHAGGEFRLGRSRMALVPNAAVFLQGKSTEINFGTGFKFDFSKRAQSNQAFQIGVWSRLVNAPDTLNGTTNPPEINSMRGISADAIIAVLRMRFGSHNFGLSYDINISRLRAASRGNGAFEVSYIYTLCGGRDRPMGCPTF